MKDINLDDVKIVIFDFDDTLAIHKNRDYVKYRNESEEGRLRYYLNAYKNPDIFYESIEPCVKSEKLCNFINEVRNKNIKMYCLSGMKFSFHLKAKQNFVDKYYGSDIEVISTSSQELKLDGVKIIKMIYNCELSEILFIDDKGDTVKYLQENGVNSLLVNDISKIF